MAAASATAGKKTAVLLDGRKKVHEQLADGTEVVDEYDPRTGDLLARRVRSGAGAPWAYEVGEAPGAARGSAAEDIGIHEAPASPVAVRQDTRDRVLWRIRNLAYPSDVYDVTVDEGAQCVVVRTSNKKYFARLRVPDFARAGARVAAAGAGLEWKHAGATLVVSIAKPRQVLEAEERARRDMSELSVQKEGDVECPQQ
eukprot:m51a1_g9834 putative protein dpcd (199) ;mRNA; f:1934178-1934858